MICINKDFFYRYEPNIDDGTFIIFNMCENRIFELNEQYYKYICLIEKKFSFEDIVDEFSKNYPEIKCNELLGNLEQIKRDLMRVGLLYELH